MTKLSNYLCLLVLGILFSSFTTSFNSPSFATNLEYVNLYESSTLAFNIQSNMTEEIINTTFHADRNDFQLSTVQTLKFIQVLDQKGDLEYQVPIETTELHLNVNDFEQGVNKIALMFNHTSELTFATLEKK